MVPWLVVLLVSAALVSGLLLGWLLIGRKRPAGGPSLDIATVPSPNALSRPGHGTVVALSKRGPGASVIMGEAVDPSLLPAEWSRTSSVLAKTSPIVSEMVRTGIMASSGIMNAYRMIVPAGVNGIPMPAGGGAIRSPIRDAKGIIGHASFKKLGGAKDLGQVLSPQLVWGLTAFAVGQHFQAEIEGRLTAIEGKLDSLAACLDAAAAAELEGARRDLNRASARILDGEHAGTVINSLSAQRLAVDTAWCAAMADLDRHAARLAALEQHETLTTRHVVDAWKDDLFASGEKPFFRDVHRFLDALTAKMQLILLMAMQEASTHDSETSVDAFRALLEEEAAECREAYSGLLALLGGLGRLKPSLDTAPIIGARRLRNAAVLDAQREALVLEAELRNDLKLPLVSSPTEPAYELVAVRQDSGDVRVAVSRIVESNVVEPFQVEQVAT